MKLTALKVVAAMWTATAGAYWLWHTGATSPWWFAAIAAATAFATWQWIFKAHHHRVHTVMHWVRPASFSARRITRWFHRKNAKEGMASWLDIMRHASGLSVWRKATVVRPSLAERSLPSRLLLQSTEVGVRLARVGMATAYSSLEDVTVVFGGPRSGKTAWAAGAAKDFPGAMLITSTRFEIVGLTQRWRQQRGPVHVFNPGGLGGRPSTIVFDPLTGCEDPTAARDRAEDMVFGGGGGAGRSSGDRLHWLSEGARMLAPLLHAAALSEHHGIRDVQRWIADIQKAAGEIVEILRDRSPDQSAIQTVMNYHGLNNDTRTSITNSIAPAFSWLSSPTARSAAGVDVPAAFRGDQLDVIDMLNQRATVYLLGEENKLTAPLVTALTGHVARAALRHAAYCPNNRLDPALGLLLDEAANIARVPLDKWTSHFGGSGLTLIPIFQSRRQLDSTWGDDQAGIIVNNAQTILFLGGNKDEHDLKRWSELTGMREEPSYTKKDGRIVSEATRPVPVLSIADFLTLPKWRAVIFRSGVAPAIGRITPVWKRWDVRYADHFPGTRWLHRLHATLTTPRLQPTPAGQLTVIDGGATPDDDDLASAS